MKKIPFIYFLLCLGVGLLTYTTLRAHHLSLTCDEGSTFANHISRNLWQCFFSETCWSDANNHWLNTLLMQKSTSLFGTSELALRLPNLFGHLLYLVSSIFLVNKISENNWIRLAGFCIINMNPFMLEFFSLARGYGLGIGFMMTSIFLFFIYLKNQKIISLSYSFLMAALAVLSNFTFLNYFACLLGVFFIISLNNFYKKEKTLTSVLQHLALPTSISLFLFLILKTPIQALRKRGEFVFGVDSLKESFYELVRDSIMGQGYLHPYTTDSFFIISILFLAISTLIGLIFFIRKKERNDFKEIYFSASLLCTLMILAIVVQYHLLDVKYLIDRKSTILIPIISIPVYLLLEYIFRENKKRIAIVFSILFIAFFFNHFYRISNLKKTTEWTYDMHTKEMIHYLKTDILKKEHTEIGVYWIFGPASQYYRKRFDLEKNITVKRVENKELPIVRQYDFIYIEKSKEGILPKNYIIKKVFGEVGILYQKTNQSSTNE